MSLEEKVNEAQWIIIGSIDSLTLENKPKSTQDQQIKVNYTLKKIVKGESSFLPETIATGFEFGNCGAPFRLRQEYLIFIDKEGFTSICHGTIRFVPQSHISLYEESEDFVKDIEQFVSGLIDEIPRFEDPLNFHTHDDCEY